MKKTKIEFVHNIPNGDWNNTTVEPKREIGNNVETCEEKDAEFFGIYIHINQAFPVGTSLPHWIADFPTKETAIEFAHFIKLFKKNIQKNG